ncbi:hypothetical protein [Paraburkholderia kururiensis]|uniref:hypothetical protein n=1 Tax=Paraburkholderia kururiensis TaxID=984307 RepID=UPI0018F62BBC|nr:hypothetical protein [Paraburkholderia kururiensis]
MTRWRFFLFTVLLMLCMPMRLAMATSLPQGTVSAAVGGTRVLAAEHSHAFPCGTPHLRIGGVQGTRARAQRGSPRFSTVHAAGPCSISCLAVAVAGEPRLTAPKLESIPFRPRRPSSDPASSFLTEGIERPPRPDQA